MDILSTQFPDYRPPADKSRSTRAESTAGPETSHTDRDLAPARVQASTITSGADAERQADEVAQIIRDRQANGFYHRPEVLRQIAARLLSSSALDESNGLGA
jgi:hypothetical protein